MTEGKVPAVAVVAAVPGSIAAVEVEPAAGPAALCPPAAAPE